VNDLIAALTKAGAPILGTIIGGPVGTLAGAAIGALAEALGTTATPEAVKTAIETGGPQAEVIVKRVEAEKAPALNADLEAILRDRQGARDQTMALVEKGSTLAWGAPVVSVVVLAGFVGLSFLAMKPESAGIRADVALYLLGAWQSLATAVVGYWIGSSAGSAAKDAAIKQIASK
jgi:hypothetical protein